MRESANARLDAVMLVVDEQRVLAHLGDVDQLARAVAAGTPRSPSSPKRIGCAVLEVDPVLRARSLTQSKAPSLKMLQFW